MMAEDKIEEIRDRAFGLSTLDHIPSADTCKLLCNDIVYLVQVIEVQKQELLFREVPDWVKKLSVKFNQLTQTQRGLILELMREMKAEDVEL